MLSKFINYCHKYTSLKGFSRFEFYRSSIYSITTSLVILFISKFDSLDFYSWVSLIIPLVLTFISVNNFTSLALILKNISDRYYRDKIDSINISSFLEQETKKLYKNKVPANLFWGVVTLIIALTIVFFSFYYNKNINSHKTNFNETLTEIKKSNSTQTDSLLALKKELDNLKSEIGVVNFKLDSLLKKCK